ncbi:uncharacterized protein TNCV_1440561 [Trichonephila clavipes]|nr:uncharacterized protein TNCV_1440561 [Trichonephila clavipes]
MDRGEQFSIFTIDARQRISREQHEVLQPDCRQLVVQAEGKGLMIWGAFVRNWIGHPYHEKGFYAEIVEVEIEVVSPFIVPSGNFAELNRTVTCIVLKANDRRTSCPRHDEFRGPRSDYVRQLLAVSVTIVNRVQKMSQRRRLPNSLRWRAVGWMEMGLSQADVARRLNVSRSVVQRLWDQYQSEDSVSRRPVPGRPRATTPAEDRFLALSARRRRTTTVPQLVADHFQASGRRISATTVRNRLHNAGLYARRPVVCVPSTDDSEGTAYAGQENMFLGRSNNGLLCCSQTSPDLQWRVIQGVY